VKSTYRYLQDEAFKMLFYRKPIWKVYKYFSLLHSLLKVDYAMNIFFLVSAFYFMHCDGQADVTYTLPFYGLFFILTTATMFQGLKAIKT
jgi:hypothetical protein